MGMKDMKELFADYHGIEAYKQDLRYSSGFKYLDKLTEGIHTGLTVLGGRPGMGKTQLALNMAYRQSVFGKLTVGYLSVGIPEIQFMNRMLAIATGLSIEEIRWAADDELDSDILNQLKKAKLVFYNDASMKYDILESKIREMASKGDFNVIYVDDLQRVIDNDDGLRGNMDSTGLVSTKLGSLARKLNISIILLSQIGRSAEERLIGDESMPQLYDLGSEEIENSADCILLVYRPEEFRKRPKASGVMFVIAAKNEFGPTGSIVLSYKSRSQTLSQYNSHDGSVELLPDTILPTTYIGDSYEDISAYYQGQEAEEKNALIRFNKKMSELSKQEAPIWNLISKLGLDIDMTSMHNPDNE